MRNTSRYARILSLMFFVAVFLTMTSTKSYAIPTLQLDLSGGTYDYDTSTIVTSSDSFTLYAYLMPNSKNKLSDTYYISIALIPATSTSQDLGTISINSTTVDVTSDMTYGIPPLENIASLQGWDSGDLPKHGIYPTYFYEYEFSFSSSDEISAYNTQDRAINEDPIDLTSNFSGNMFYAAFTIDTSSLDSEYSVHFDLYNTALKCGGDIDVTQFAPFSHDAEATHSVPEPGTLLLLSSGLLGLAALKRIRNRRGKDDQSAR